MLVRVCFKIATGGGESCGVRTVSSLEVGFELLVRVTAALLVV